MVSGEWRVASGVAYLPAVRLCAPNDDDSVVVIIVIVLAVIDSGGTWE